MHNKVLDYLYGQGGFTLFAFIGKKSSKEIPLEALQNTALALNAGAGFILVDFSGEMQVPNSTYFTQDLLRDRLTVKQLESNKNKEYIFVGHRDFPKSHEEFRNLYHNLHLLQNYCPQIIGILPEEITPQEAKYIPLISRLLIISGDSNEGLEQAFGTLEDFSEIRKTNILWLFNELPNKKRFPKAHKIITKGNSCLKECKELTNNQWTKNPLYFAQVIETLHRIEILEKNPLDGIPKLFRKLYPFLLILAIIIPFFFVTKLSPTVINSRNRIHERDVITTAPFFEYTFDGKESLNRIARYGIGRFCAKVADEKMIKQYMEVTLNENGYTGNSWAKEAQVYPPAGTVIKFSRPDMFTKTAKDSIGAAWKYWTSIYSDSIAYLTELYHENQTPTQRKHQAIDVAGKQGARILAPFSAKAWTSRDERGGIIIGLVHETQVIIFMHCDQLLYLDGQEVMAGDPIATVGMSGHTTGPHAHIVTGIVDKTGSKQIGNIHYNVIDPVAWYYQFKPKSLK